MIDIKKFIKAVELVKVENLWSMGLVVNKSGKRIFWNKLIKKPKVKVEIISDKTETEILKEIFKGIKSKKWIILEIKDNLSSKVYSQLKLLSISNRIQFKEKENIVDLQQTEKTRIIVTGLKEVINLVQKQHPDFKNLFGPVITI